MNWEKLAISRNFMFVTCFIPGMALIFVIAVKIPLLRQQFEAMEFLGYKTKLALLLMLSFAAGFPIQGIFVLARFRFNRRREKRDREEVAGILSDSKPWNCKMWRALAQQMLALEIPSYATQVEIEDYWEKLHKRLEYFRAVEWDPRNYRSIRFFAAAFVSASVILTIGSLIPSLSCQPQCALVVLSLVFSIVWSAVLYIYVFHVPAGRKSEYANPGRAQDLFMIRLLLTRSISSLDTK